MLRRDSGPPGFYLLEKPFSLLADRVGLDALLRVPSLLAALLLFAGAPTLPPGRARAVFALLLSAEVLLTLYAAEARPYALLSLLCLTLFLLSLRGEESVARLLALAALSAAALYTHYLAIFAVGVLFLLALAARRGKASLALAAGAAAFLPWAPVLRAQPPEAIVWMREPLADSVAGFLSTLGGVGRVPSPLGGPAPRPLFLAALLVGIFLLGATAASARRDRDAREALAFVLAVLAAALAFGTFHPIAFAGRTEMTVLPVWIWLLALGFPRSRAVRGGAVAAALLGLAATAALLVSVRRRAEGTQVAATLSAVARKGDTIVAAAGFYLPLRLAAEQARLAATVRALPEELSAHPGWFIPSIPGEEERAALEREASLLPPGGRLFVVLPPAYVTPELVAALEAPGGRRRELARGRDVLVMLRTRDRDSPAAPAGPSRSPTPATRAP